MLIRKRSPIPRGQFELQVVRRLEVAYANRKQFLSAVGQARPDAMCA